MKISEALNNVINKFQDGGIETPDLDARILLAHILKTEKHRLIIDSDKELPAGSLNEFYISVERRLKKEPVAYITGKKEFYSIDFIVTKDVLIPRPETEQIVDIVLSCAGKNASVLDIGTGSGAIAIAIKKNRPDLNVFACDISAKTLKIAKKNAQKILGNDSVLFSRSDLLKAYRGKKFDLIVSNPPYLNEDEKISFQKELFYEPARALFASNCGKNVLKRIIAAAYDSLKSNGLLVLEFGSGQESFLEKTAGINYSVKIYKDLADLPRIAVLQKLEV